ncbi:MAG: GHKL domain-containing protein [Lachnospiraceae bacterium]|nr:GHKL domain-containing protein [Lachnospiraceae bacterium]
MDMEWYWDMAVHISSIIRIVITGFWLYRFTEPYLRGKSQAKAVGLAYAGMMFVMYAIPLEMDGAIAYGMGVLAAFAAMCLADRRNRAQKVFLAMLMYLLNDITSSLAIIPRDILFENIIYHPYVQQNLWRQFACFLAIELVYVISCFYIMKVLVRMINRVYVHKRENMQIKELALMLATPFLALTGYLVFLYFSNIWLGTFQTYIWNAYYQYIWIKALYQAAAYAAILTTIVLYQSIKGSHRREKENAVLAEQMADMKRHIGRMEAVYSDIRGLKHDMGNHVLTLEALLEKKEHREAEAYLSGLKEQINKIEEEIKTGNPVTDVILAEKQKEAAQRGIDFICDFHYPEGTKANALDISVILNNAADNAIKAAGECEKPYIQIKSWRQKNAYMLEVKNPFAGNLLIDGESGLPESGRSGDGHGFGLKNIRKVARSYHGDIDVRWEENLFILSVMLMLE